MSAASSVTVACCQLALSVEDPAGNVQAVQQALSGAVRAGAQIIVLPELAFSGYVFRDRVELVSHAQAPDGPAVRLLEDFARRHRVVVVAGFAESDGERVRNSAVVVDENGTRAVYRKAHLWNTEKPTGFTPGDQEPPVVDTAFGRIGVMVCYDLEFPEWVRSVALQGADLLCAPVNWPSAPRPAGERPAEVVKVQADAAVNRLPIAVADRVRTERGVDWIGGSVIVDADGFPLTRLQLGEPTMVTAVVDLAQSRIKRISDDNDVFGDRRPELYGRVTAG